MVIVIHDTTRQGTRQTGSFEDQAWETPLMKYGLVGPDNHNGVFPFIHPVTGNTV